MKASKPSRAIALCGTEQPDTPGRTLTAGPLSVEFDNRGTMVPALKGISFRIRAGSTVALVGESGSGKSVTAQAMMGILPKTARISSGKILFTAPGSGKPPRDITKLKPDGIVLRAAHEFAGQGAPVTAAAASTRTRLFVTGDARGRIQVAQMTTEKVVAEGFVDAADVGQRHVLLDRPTLERRLAGFVERGDPAVTAAVVTPTEP